MIHGSILRLSVTCGRWEKRKRLRAEEDSPNFAAKAGCEEQVFPAAKIGTVPWSRHSRYIR